MSTIKVNRIENTATTAGGIDIDSSGRAGIGASNNSSYDSIAQNLLVADESGNTGITIRSGGSTPFGAIQFADGTGSNAEKRAGRIIYQHAIDTLSFSTANAERLRISSDGNLGVGTSSPLRHLHLAGAGDTGLMLQTTNAVDNNEIWEIQVAGNASNHADLIFRSRTNAGTGGSEAMRIDSSGRLLVGTSSSRGGFFAGTSGFDPLFQIEQPGYSVASIIRNSNNTASPTIVLGKSRGAANGATTIVSSGDSIGEIAFQAADGAKLVPAASIYGQVDGTPGTNDMPGRLVFSTTADGAASPTERFRINSNGNVKLTGGEALFWDDAGDRYIACIGDTSSNINLHGRANVIFKTGGSSYDGGTERMRISSGGEVLINRTTTTVDSSNFGTRIGGAGTSIGVLVTSRNVGTSSSVAAFYGQSGLLAVMGDGDCENTNNRYTGISDVKLKENIVDANSQWDDIKALQVRNYNFKEETGYGTHTQLGLVAQEVETICPGLVGESNDTDGDLNETGTVTKSVAYSVLYMKAVKALQEAQTRIETLETQHATLLARVTALEAA
jgi:hypothetical protein